MTPILVPQIVRNSLQQLQDTIWPTSQTAPRPNDQARRIEALRHLADEMLRSIERPLPPLDPAVIPTKGNPLTGEGFKTT